MNIENETKAPPDCPQENESATLRAAGMALQSLCHNASYRAGWWHLRHHSPPYGVIMLDLRAVIHKSLGPVETRLAKALVNEKLMLIVSEVSEAMEGWRKDAQDDKLPHRKMIEVELADAVIRIADLAGALGLDLGGAVAEKMAYNAERADHKPEARAAAGGKSF